METVDFKFELGSVLKEKVTGLTGVVMAQTKYHTGCKHYALLSQSLTTDGKPKEWEYFDESRLMLVDSEKVLEEPSESTSGPGHNPPSVG